jgi:type II secretory pathway component PulF
VEAVVLVAVAAVLRLLLRGGAGSFVGDRIRLALPVYGPYHRADATARFLRTLHLLIASKAPLASSLDLAGAAAGNTVIRRAAQSVARMAADGAALADAFEEAGRFEQLLCWLVAQGEVRDDLEGALDNLATTYEQRAERSSRLFTMLAGPVVVVVVAIIIGGLFLALSLPLAQVLNTMV